MRALVFDGCLALATDHPDPSPGLGEVLIRVRMAGVCSTDLEITRGYFGFRGVLGHEFVGIVEHSPDPAWVGRRVVAEINWACGECGACRRGLGRHCPHGATEITEQKMFGRSTVRPFGGSKERVQSFACS